MTHVKCYRALQRKAREKKEGEWEFRCPECQRVVNSFLPMDEVVFSSWERVDMSSAMALMMSSSQQSFHLSSLSTVSTSLALQSRRQASSSSSSSPFLELTNTLHSLLLHTVSLSFTHQQTHLHTLFTNSLQQLQSCCRTFCDTDAGWRNFSLSHR